MYIYIATYAQIEKSSVLAPINSATHQVCLRFLEAAFGAGDAAALALALGKGSDLLLVRRRRLGLCSVSSCWSGFWFSSSASAFSCSFCSRLFLALRMSFFNILNLASTDKKSAQGFLIDSFTASIFSWNLSWLIASKISFRRSYGIYTYIYIHKQTIGYSQIYNRS